MWDLHAFIFLHNHQLADTHSPTTAFANKILGKALEWANFLRAHADQSQVRFCCSLGTSSRVLKKNSRALRL
jgi:hypothetical protein